MPIVGVIENMAGFTTPDGQHFDIFGTGGGASLADELGVPLLASVPIDPGVATGADAGDPVVVGQPDSPAATAIIDAAARITEILPPLALDTCVGRIGTLLAELESA
jgi:ATP-binding protein involved in chromosome partitioning